MVILFGLVRFLAMSSDVIESPFSLVYFGRLWLSCTSLRNYHGYPGIGGWVNMSYSSNFSKSAFCLIMNHLPVCYTHVSPN